MALFELKDGRLGTVGPGHPAGAETRLQVLAAVRAQLGQVLHRPLMPVAWMSVEAGQSLTALDAAGQVVTIEVLTTVDAGALVAALSRHARTAAMSRSSLAVVYPGGATAFHEDWDEFREAMPIHAEPGPRLVVLTTELVGQARVLATFLGEAVEVHVVDARVVEGAGDGRVLVSVDRVEADPLAAAAAAPSTPRRSRAAQVVDTAQTAQVTQVVNTIQATQPGHSGRPQAVTASGTRPAAAVEPPPVTGTHRSLAPALGAQPTVSTAEAPATLAALARSLRTPTTLLWRSPRRGIDHRAVLSRDGVITLADGRTFTDPSRAAAAAQHTQDVDGWRVWRVGERGATLAELLS
ncbi:hypothetical protein [Actinomyces sp. W5033]|uniref:restriction system modified-DNA reader domain-containing protein n=1 Tax=Actinomyces sp. W5033 TaxID=3446479 RepID=UPI003EDEE097